ncbi:MAG: hypothetical protein ACTS2F_11165 [Thainema sp.]
MQSLPTPPPQPLTQSSRPPSRAAAKLRSQNHPHQARRNRSSARSVQRELLIEVSLKLGVNLLLIALAGSTIARLLPYHQNQQAKLKQIKTELSRTEQRVDTIETDFSRHFDPQQVGSIMQEQTNRLQPNQRQVVWVDPYPASQH